VWKAIVEWGSRLHGSGAGDPQGGNLLGDGGANFDAMWSGAATGQGNTNHNIVSTQTCGAGGPLAFTETPISDGWRIKYCEEWVWDDGPGTIGGRFDIQGVMVHEYGHALGLGHSAVAGATMAPAVSAGSTAIRSIAADDIAGIQCVYGVASASKPVITATVGNSGAGTLTIYGSNFASTGNEVWLTSNTATLAGSDPIVRVAGVGSTSGGTVITISVPAGAGPGDVMINGPTTGNQTLSNAFPTDLVGTFGTPPVSHPAIATVTPSTIDALIPGTGETITITGTGLDLATSVLLDGTPIDPARYTIVGPTTITLDMPQAATLGGHSLEVSDASSTSSFAVTVVAVTTPKLEMGSGDPLNVVDRTNGLTCILAGPPGQTHRLLVSASNLPSVAPGVVSLDIGNSFTQLFQAGDFVIPAAGWLQVFFPTSSLIDPGPGGKTFYGQSVRLGPPNPLDDSNLQSFVLVQ
jgi:hypothetical protein